MISMNGVQTSSLLHPRVHEVSVELSRVVGVFENTFVGCDIPYLIISMHNDSVVKSGGLC